MLRLFGKTTSRWNGEPEVLRISTDPDRDFSLREGEACLIQNGKKPRGFKRYFVVDGATQCGASSEVCVLPAWMDYLGDGDIIRVSPSTGDVSVLYRRSSRFNSMLLTEQCNSNCIMCSQPPKATEDRHLVEAYLKAIPLMDVDTAELGITGGEPTLLREQLFDLIVACEKYLPSTALHMLSNGRMFNYLSLCQALAEIGHHDFVIGIPLYSDIARKHNFVVQAKDAFDQTLRGLMNLERCGMRIEVRVVLHRETIERLPHLARFITRNLPFVEHVALMGLEMMGHVRMNLDALWIDPADYWSPLMDTVWILKREMRVSIYNHQLCTLPCELWPYAQKSISDWKNEYLEECSTCVVRDECGGFFSSSRVRRSKHIKPIAESGLDCHSCGPKYQRHK